MQVDPLFKLAFNNNEVNTVAYLMIQYYAQYVEGCIEESKDKFNFVYRHLTKDMWLKLREQNREVGFEGLERIIDANLSNAPIVRAISF